MSEDKRVAWSDDDVRLLIELTGAQPPLRYAEIIRRFPRFTRSSVISKIRRLGIERRPNPVKSTGDAGAARAPRSPTSHAALPSMPPIPLTLPSAEKTDVVTVTVTIVPSSKPRCCWPMGDPGNKGFRFCDDPKLVSGKPYCAKHVARAYQPSSRLASALGIQPSVDA